MAKEKNKLDRAVGRTAEILLAHLGNLPRAQAKAMREELHRVAVKISRSVRRGKA
jgi:ribosomal protein L10